MSVTTDRPAAPRALRLAWILLIVVALVVAAAGIAVVGARLLEPSPALPLGGAAVIAFASRRRRDRSHVGDIYTVQRRWHRPAPADRCVRCTFRHRQAPRVVARWHAHRLPQLPGRQRLGRGDRRRRRQPDDPVDECRRARRGLRRARRLRVVAGRADRGLRRPRRCAPASQTCSSSRRTGRRQAGRGFCLRARAACSRGSRPTANRSPSWAVRAAAPPASTWPMCGSAGALAGGLQARRIGPRSRRSP